MQAKIPLGVDFPPELCSTTKNVVRTFDKTAKTIEIVKLILGEKLFLNDGNVNDFYLYGELDTNDGKKVVVFKSDKTLKDYFLKPNVRFSSFKYIKFILLTYFFLQNKKECDKDCVEILHLLTRGEWSKKDKRSIRLFCSCGESSGLHCKETEADNHRKLEFVRQGNRHT